MHIYNFLIANILSLLGNCAIFYSILIFYCCLKNVDFNPFTYIRFFLYYVISLFLLFPLWIIEKLLSKKYPQIKFLSKQNSIPLWYKINFYIGLFFSVICFIFSIIYYIIPYVIHNYIMPLIK